MTNLPTDLYQKKPNQNLKCLVCQRGCQISPGKVGFCKTKKNQNGKLKDLVYGIITGYQVDPIEKKPLYHVLPGAQVLSIGSFGCNYRCKQCLNYTCSYGEVAQKTLDRLASQAKTKRIKPSQVVSRALEIGLPGIAYTYNEPTIWSPFAHDVAKLAKAQGLLNVFVSNGSWTKPTINRLAPLIDAANIDLKGFSKKTYQKQGAFWGNILDNLKHAFKKGIFLELTTLLIPGVNDSEEELKKLTKWVASQLDPQVPWHLSQFSPELSPDPDFQKIPQTPVKTLKKAAEIGKKTGLKHIYVWAPNSNFSQGETTCPQCQAVLVKRSGWQPKTSNLNSQNGQCKKCGQKILGIWQK